MDFDFKKVLFSHKDKTSVDKGVSIDVFTSGCFQPSDATELTRLFSISESLSPLLKSRGPLFKSLGFTEYAFECSQSYHMIFFSWFYHCLPSNVICHETGSNLQWFPSIRCPPFDVSHHAFYGILSAGSGLK